MVSEAVLSRESGLLMAGLSQLCRQELEVRSKLPMWVLQSNAGDQRKPHSDSRMDRVREAEEEEVSANLWINRKRMQGALAFMRSPRHVPNQRILHTALHRQ